MPTEKSNIKPITPAQLKLIHVLLGELGLMKHKAELVFSFTGQRTASSRDMTRPEAKELIGYLKGSQERDTVLRRIWHLAYGMEIIIEGDHNERAMNAATLNAFCRQRGTVKKPLFDQSLKELKRTARQFEAMYDKYKQKKERESFMDLLKKELDRQISLENYEEAARIKTVIDIQNEQNKPKRKKAAKAV